MRLIAGPAHQIAGEPAGVRPETLKARIKAEMVWTSLVRGRFKESLQVGERDVAAAVREKGDEKLEVEAFEYKMQPVVLIVPRGSPSAAIEQRKKEAEQLRERVQCCEEANSYFKSMQNAAVRDVVTKTTGRYPGSAARPARQDPDRPSDPARSDQTGRRDGGAVRTQADQDRHAEEERRSGTRCSSKNTRRSRNPICRKSAKPR